MEINWKLSTKNNSNSTDNKSVEKHENNIKRELKQLLCVTIAWIRFSASNSVLSVEFLFCATDRFRSGILHDCNTGVGSVLATETGMTFIICLVSVGVETGFVSILHAKTGFDSILHDKIGAASVLLLTIFVSALLVGLAFVCGFCKSLIENG